MGVSIQCDERVEVKRTPAVIEIVYKNAKVQYYRNDTCEVGLSIGVSGTEKAYCSIEISIIRENRSTGSVMFDFPYELRKIAFDTYVEIVDAMTECGMVDPMKKE